VSRRREPLASLAAAVLALAALLAGACSSDGDDEQVTVIEEAGDGVLESSDDSAPIEPVAGMPDPCSLVTDDEVGAAADVEPTSTSRAQLTPSSAECTFLTDESAVAIVSVDVDPDSQILSADDYDDAVEAIEGEEVDGLGAWARWSPVLGSVTTTDGERLLTVTMVITDQDPDDLREPAVQLAEAALGRL
jgi:hypothetical protein